MNEDKNIYGPDYEEIDLYELFTAQEFVERIADIEEKTRIHGIEYGFDVERVFKTATNVLEMSEGTEYECNGSENATITGNNYLAMILHSHPPGLLGLPSAGDLDSLYLHQRLNEIGGFNTYTIGAVIATTERPDYFSLALHQEQRRLENFALLKKWVAIEQSLKDRLQKDPDLAYEIYHQMHEELIKPYYVTGILIYERKGSNAVLREKGAFGFLDQGNISPLTVPTKDVLAPFSFCTYKITD